MYTAEVPLVVMPQKYEFGATVITIIEDGSIVKVAVDVPVGTTQFVVASAEVVA